VFRRASAVREVVTGHRLHTVSEPRHFPSSALRQGGHRCATQGVPGVGERPRPGRPATGPGAWAAPRDRLVDHEPRQHGSRRSQGRGQARAAVHARQPGGHLRRERVREVLPKRQQLASAHGAARARAARASPAQGGARLVREAEAPSRGRFARPRAAWWHGNAPRARLPTRPLRHRHSRRAEPRTRHAWGRSRRGRRRPRGVWRSGRGAVHDGTSQGFSQVVPQGAPEGLRPERQPSLALFGPSGPAGVLGGDRSGRPRAHTLAATRAPGRARLRLQGWPARCGHPLHPLEGFGRVLQDGLRAGRCFPALQPLSQRTRRVLMAPQEQPISAFHGAQIPPRT
jgi:hypothetical protein